MPEPKDYKTVGVISPRTRTLNHKDAALGRDRESYKRLRRDGLQPPHVKGSSALERDATMPVEVEMGRVYRSKVGKALAKEGVERSREIHLRSPDA